MDGVRNSFSRFKKDVKHRLRGKRHTPDRAGDDAIEERIYSLGSLLRPGSRATASGHDGEGSRASTDVRNPNPRDQFPQPEPTQPGEGRDDPPKKEVGVGDKEVGQRYLRAEPEIGVTGERERGREVEQEPDSAKTVSPLSLRRLIISPGNADPNEKKSNWKPTAYATAKLLLCGVRDSADAFDPLKFVAGGLCFILDNCEVGSSLVCIITALTGIPANGGECANNSIVGTAGQSPRRNTLCACF